MFEGKLDAGTGVIKHVIQDDVADEATIETTPAVIAAHKVFSANELEARIEVYKELAEQRKPIQ